MIGFLTTYEVDLVNLLGGVYANLKYKCHLLLPVGGPMTVTEYWHVDVFRPGGLGQIEQCTFELQQLDVSCQNAQTTTTPLSEN